MFHQSHLHQISSEPCGPACGCFVCSNPGSPLSLSLATARLGLTWYRKAKKNRPEEENTYGLPNGSDIRKNLIDFFRKQKKRILKWMKTTVTTELPASIPPVTDWNDPMARRMTPILEGYWDQGGKQAAVRLLWQLPLVGLRQHHLRYRHKD